MLAHASEYNMRIVLVTLRDYPGSTPYSPAELDVIFSQDVDSQADFMQARSMEIASFLVWLVKGENLPPISTSSIPINEDGKPSGGIALLGWSSGSALVLSLVANADKLPAETQELLDAHLRTCFLWGTRETEHLSSGLY